MSDIHQRNPSKQCALKTQGPNLVIVGAPRSGSTYLYRALGKHSQIFQSPVKEPHYFLSDRWPLGGPEKDAFTKPLEEFFDGKRKTVWGGLVRDESDYLSLFQNAGSQSWRMEATPNYFAEGKVMAERLNYMLSDETRILIALRDPVERLKSHYKLFCQNGWETLPFFRALLAAAERLENGWAPTWDYVRYSQISAPLAQWTGVFGDRLKTVQFEDLKYQSANVFSELQNWLGIRHEILPTKSFRNASEDIEVPSDQEIRDFLSSEFQFDYQSESDARSRWRISGKKPPLVTIGMPVHNGEHTIKGALGSLLEQSYPNFKVVVCDNASTDGTAEVVQNIASSTERVEYWHYADLVEIQGSYRRALETRQEGYFMFAPSDDRWGSEFLEQSVAFLESTPDASVCCGQIEMFDDTGRKWLSTGARPVLGAKPNRWTNALLATSDASRLYGLIRSSACTDIIPSTAPEGWDHYTCAKLALRGKIGSISVPAMTRHQTPKEKYRALVFKQEETFWGRVFFARHVLGLFKADEEFDTRSLKARAALISFLFNQTRLALYEQRWRPLRFCFKLVSVLGKIISKLCK